MCAIAVMCSMLGPFRVPQCRDRQRLRLSLRRTHAPPSSSAKVAQPALEKQRADEAAYAQLVKDDIPAVPIHTGLDGGMNAVFHPPFPYSFISLANVLLDGSLELPPFPPVPYADNNGSLPSRVFEAEFGRKPVPRT